MILVALFTQTILVPYGLVPSVPSKQVCPDFVVFAVCGLAHCDLFYQGLNLKFCKYVFKRRVVIVYVAFLVFLLRDFRFSIMR